MHGWGFLLMKKNILIFFRFTNIEECELLHFCGARKPWMPDGFMNQESKKIWLEYYSDGSIDKTL